MAVLIRTEANLTIHLTNYDGYPTDAFSVRWTVYSNDGIQISGKNLLAIKRCTGTYCAPWFANTYNGNYVVNWEVQAESGGPVQYVFDKFFVIDPASYQVPHLHADAVPIPGGFTYLTNTSLGRGDLPLFLRNSDGIPADAYSVFWTIYGMQHWLPHCEHVVSHYHHHNPYHPVSVRTAASHAATGEYFAAWTASVCTGNYIIKWDWAADSTSPLESKSMGFTVISPHMPYIYHGVMPKLVLQKCCHSPCAPCHWTPPSCSCHTGFFSP